MSEMLDRVMRAVAKELQRQHDTLRVHWDDENHRLDGDVDLREVLRAGIAEMREPTEAMLDAVDVVVDAGEDQDARLTSRGASEAWQQMIDAALKA